MLRAIAKLATKEIERRLAQRETTRKFLILMPLLPILGVLFAIMVVTLIAVIVISGQAAATCDTNLATPVSAPVGQVASMGPMVRYLETQNFTLNAAAGVIGNAYQENGLSPVGSDGAGGGGMLMWNASWYATMSRYATANGQSPTSSAGQLMYIAYEMNANNPGGFIREPGLLQKMNAASSPSAAATMFETGYEACSGVLAFNVVVPGSLCNDPRRRGAAETAAHAAGGSSGQPVSLAPAGGQCLTANVGGYVNPVSKVTGLGPSRTDMGVDYTDTAPSPILAVGDGEIVNTAANGWPGVSFIEEKLANGAYAGKCWYAAENISPTVSVHQHVQAGDQIGTLMPGSPNSEFGWSVCRGGTTLAASLNEQYPGGDPGAWMSAAGASASRFLVSLGAPAGTGGSPIPGGPHGPLPSGYP